MSIMGFKKSKSPKTKKVKKPKKKSVKYWSNKCDKEWGRIICQVGACEICGRKDTLQPHHLIGKTGAMTKYRHDLSNGLCLCYYHHCRDPIISGHGSTAAAENLMKWLCENRNGQYVWCKEHQDNKEFEKRDLEQIYNELKEM